MGWSKERQHTSSQIRILKDVKSRKLPGVHALQAQNLDARPRKPALRRFGRALHEEHHGRGAHRLGDGLTGFIGEKPALEEEGGRMSSAGKSGRPGGLSKEALVFELASGFQGQRIVG
jgi:hypothetical protein